MGGRGGKVGQPTQLREIVEVRNFAVAFRTRTRRAKIMSVERLQKARKHQDAKLR